MGHLKKPHIEAVLQKQEERKPHHLVLKGVNRES